MPGENLSQVSDLFRARFNSHRPVIAYYSGATADLNKAQQYAESTKGILKDVADVVVIDPLSNQLKTINETLRKADGILIPGGNTYVLAQRMRQIGLWEAVSNAILRGKHYIGFSAGAVISGQSIVLTNTPNIPQLSELRGLGIVDAVFHMHVKNTSESLENESRLIQEYHMYWNHPVLSFGDTAVMRIDQHGVHLVQGDCWMTLPGESLRPVHTGIVCEIRVR
jgi:peptidase E